MKKPIVVAAVATLFLWGLPNSLAQAQKPNSPIVTTKINLSMEERHTIKEIIKDLKIESAPRDTQTAIGTRVSKSVKLRTMPADVSAKVSHIQNHLFFVKGNKVILVDQKDNKVVDVID